MAPETPNHGDHARPQPLKLRHAHSHIRKPDPPLSLSSLQRMKKRKDLQLQHFHDDFPSIPSSTSSRKSRRLDAELCTIMEEEEEEDPNPNVVMLHEDDPAPAAHVAPSPSSGETALVQYDPTNARLVKSPTSPDFSIVINADLIPGLKDYLLSWGIAKPDNSQENEMRREKSSESSNDCLAVVPWVAFNSPVPSEEIVPETGQLLEVEGGEMMEMDEPYVNNNSENAMEIGDKEETVGSPSLWQQQHCMMLNVLQNA